MLYINGSNHYLYVKGVSSHITFVMLDIYI